MVNMSPVRESLRDSSSESGSESDNASASLRSSRSGSRASQAPVQTSSNASGRRVSRSASQSPVEMDVDVPLVPEVVHDTITLEDTGSRGSSQPELTSQELYALLQALWRDNELVKFSDLIPKTMYTKRDAATAFAILLELEAQKKLVLHQKSSFCTVRISKYNYSE
ncbi:PREDICTED: uncharacterized protein LOC105571186 isoform X2 [Vollenhovia emeryi]|uniref:uncharacterized protein LOC105571186 isoform X2 n=1 Tax=Vollenhovia emeryi TaxID=411798 RepID=UPI0005F550C5|nr:PREDICTED: uncharacterized protein LOC105571186 isoform X2 [Vollenhovia emeryi]